METYISEAEILDRIRKYKESLSEKDNVLINAELKPIKLTDKTREKLATQLKASEQRSIRYKEKYEALRIKRESTI